VLLSTIRSLGWFYGAFLLLSIGVATTGHPVMMKAVINWFRRRASLATGIQASGGALGGLMIILVAILIDIFEWRLAVLLLGFSIWLICLPLALLVRHKPEQYGYLPDGDQAEIVSGSEGAAGSVHLRVDSSTRQALKQRTFWHIALALTCQIVVVSAVMTHVMPYLSSINVSRSSSALLASALPIASVAGRLGFGWFGDRVSKRQLSAVGFASLGLGLVFFGYSAGGATWLLLPFLILFSTGWGGNVTMRAAMVQEYFGRERFGTIHGLMIGIITLGSMVGPPMAGWVYDRWQSYEGAWFALAAFSALAMIIMLTTPKRAAYGTAK
jgi:sugar phosphate permease